MRAEQSATEAVAVQEQLLIELTSFHVEDPMHISWEDIKNESPPVQPTRSAEAEEAANTKFKQFKPSWVDKIVGYKRKVRRLELNILKAVAKDEQKHAGAMLAYEQQVDAWEALQRISGGVLDGEPAAFKEAVEYFHLFVNLEGQAKSLSMIVNEGKVTVALRVLDTDIVPGYISSKTAGGKLSQKKMPQSKMNKIYQDHVCSAVLRVARDLLAFFPLKGLVVNATSNRLNSATGNRENQVLLSVLFYPTSLDEINFSAIDPSNAMGNFPHKMKFTQSGGFVAVESIDVGSISHLGKGK